jgi:hypothetical protein
MDVRPMQLNAPSPIDVTLLGIVMAVNPVQPLNAYFPIDLTPSGIVIDLRLEHGSNGIRNAHSPIVLTLPGIVTVVSPVQL